MNYTIKGNFCFSKDAKTLITMTGYVPVKDGISQGVFEELPEAFKDYELIDYGDQIIIPGLCDLHVHAPQYAFRGLGMDMELLDWLNVHAFPEEAKYSNIEYAKKAYSIFTDDLLHSVTSRAVIFATLHVHSTMELMDQLEKTGLKTFVGKVNMDRNSPDILREENAEASISATKQWLKACKEKQYENVKPILTPRFTPSCTDALMEGLGKLRSEYQLPVQSHLSENLSEVEWVKELCPNTKNYGEAYDQFGMFGGVKGTIMAHCVWSDDNEIELMKQQGVFIAHCPESNANVASGIAPVRKYLDLGMKIGLGSDVAGGSQLSLFKAITESIQYSKLRFRCMDSSLGFIGLDEAFYMATKGGGEFFGKVGSFEKGYEFDACVLDDSFIRHPQELNVRDRLERLIYLNGELGLTAKYVAGKKVL